MKRTVRISMLSVFLCFSLFLFGCEASKTEHTKRDNIQPTNPEETVPPENVYSLTYLPVRNGFEQKDYQILDGES